jgi:hypothetical protein
VIAVEGGSKPQTGGVADLGRGDAVAGRCHDKNPERSGLTSRYSEALGPSGRRGQALHGVRLTWDTLDPASAARCGCCGWCAGGGTNAWGALVRRPSRFPNLTMPQLPWPGLPVISLECTPDPCRAASGCLAP